METTPPASSTLFSRTNEPASTSVICIQRTTYIELTTLRHERFRRRGLLESQAFAPIVDNARFAIRSHDMLRFVGEMLGMGSNPDNAKIWFHVIASSGSAIINGYHMISPRIVCRMNVFGLRCCYLHKLRTISAQ